MRFNSASAVEVGTQVIVKIGSVQGVIVRTGIVRSASRNNNWTTIGIEFRPPEGPLTAEQVLEILSRSQTAFDQRAA